MNVKISEKGIYKIIPSAEGLSSEQIYNILESYLDRDENIFAKFSASNGMYYWDCPGSGWHKMSEADQFVKGEINDVIEQKRRLIEPKLKDTLIKPLDALFNVPSEDYIYYRYKDDNSIEVILVAWDYRFPARGPEETGHIKVKKPAKKQDVKITIKEAGNNVPNYKLLIRKLNGDGFADKETDSSGSLQMKLPVGFECVIMSKDKEHDFTFIVEEDKSEYVFDITKPLEVKIYVEKDDKPADNLPVNVNYNGSDIVLYTNLEGVALTSLDFVKDAVINVVAENQTQSVQVQYPSTEISIHIKTPKALIDVIYRKNRIPVEGEDVVLNITGQGSVMLTTDRKGCVTYTIPYRDNVDVSVKVGSVEQTKSLEKHTEFIIEENVVVPPPLPPEPEPDLVDDDINEEPEPVAPKPYNIYVKVEKGNYVQGSIILKQDDNEYKIPLDNEGRCSVERDMVIPNKIVNATVDTKLGVFDDFDLEFEEDEDDYEIMLKLRRKSQFWSILLEVLAATAVTFSLIMIYVLFEGLFF